MTQALRHVYFTEKWASTSQVQKPRNQWGELVLEPPPQQAYDIDFSAISKSMSNQRDAFPEGMRQSGARVVWIHRKYAELLEIFRPGLKILRRATGKYYTTIEVEERKSYYRCICEEIHELKPSRTSSNGITYFDALNRSVRLAVALGMRLPSELVIPSHDSMGFAPGETYAVVNFLRARRVGYPWYRNERLASEIGVEAEYYKRTSTQLEMVVRCECYGPGAYDHVLLLAQWWVSQEGTAFLSLIRAAEIGWGEDVELGHIESGPVQRLDEFISAEWESRAAQDVTLGAISTLNQIQILGVVSDDWTVWIEE